MTVESIDSAIEPASQVAPATSTPATSIAAAAASSKPMLVFATQGAGHGDETRILDLIGELDHRRFAFDRRGKIKSAWQLFQSIRRQRPSLVLMEGTGIGGGLAVILGRLVAGVPYVVSSGDAVSPYLSARMPVMKPLFALYERMLCRFSAGFIGWTPYLVGRALSFGAPRAMTAAGWCDDRVTESERLAARARIRQQLGIGQDEIVIGLVGSLDWNPRVNYCYGWELVRAISQVTRPGVRVVIVGDGSGRAHLEKAAGDRLGKSIVLTGKVSRADVPAYLAAMDIGSLPQSVDGVGSFRYTIKLSEYLAAGLPVVTGQIPLAYDLDEGWLWRLTGKSPWDPAYIGALAQLMLEITPDQIRSHRDAIPQSSATFDRQSQIRRTNAFLSDLLSCAQ